MTSPFDPPTPGAIPALPAVPPSPSLPTVPAAPTPSLPTLPGGNIEPVVQVAPPPLATPAEVTGGGADEVPDGYVAFEPGAPSVQLLATAWARHAWLIGNLLAAAAAFGVAQPYWVVPVFLLLPVWSLMVGVNIRRVKPSSAHAKAPHPVALALSWFTPLMVIGGVFVVAGVLSSAAEQRQPVNGADELGLADLSLGILIVGIVAGIISAYVPYGVHRRAARWVNGSTSNFSKWFWGPLLAGVFAGVASQMMLRAGLALGAPEAALFGVVIAGMCVSPAVYLVVGNRAMRDLEHATETLRSQHAVQDRPAGDLTDAQLAALSGATR